MKEIFISEDGITHTGPFSIDFLITNKISPDTLVWYRGLDTWKNAVDVKDLEHAIHLTPPPLGLVPAALDLNQSDFSVPSPPPLPPISSDEFHEQRAARSLDSSDLSTPPQITHSAISDERESSSSQASPSTRERKKMDPLIISLLLISLTLIAVICYGIFYHQREKSNTDLATEWEVGIVDLRNKVGNADIYITGVLSFKHGQGDEFTTSATLKERLSAPILKPSIVFDPDGDLDSVAAAYVPRTYQLTLTVKRSEENNNTFVVEKGIIRPTGNTAAGDTLSSASTLNIWGSTSKIRFQRRKIIILCETESSDPNKKENYFTLYGSEVNRRIF